MLQRAATAAQSLFTVVGGSLCALILLDYSKLVLLFTIMFGSTPAFANGLRERSILKSSKGTEWKGSLFFMFSNIL